MIVNVLSDALDDLTRVRRAPDLAGQAKRRAAKSKRRSVKAARKANRR